jgi:glycosyltransferase involved in cell wall biosynthesis
VEIDEPARRPDALRLAITVDPYLPVPPLLYGGIERVVDLLVRGLVARGHAVTLFAHPDSRTPAVLRPYGLPPHTGAATRFRELLQVGRGLRQLRRSLDLVHSFGRLAALLPILRDRALPKIQSYQRAVPWTGVRRAAVLAGESLTFTGCSTSLYADAVSSGVAAGRWHTVFNGVDVSRYAAVEAVPPDAPLMFLGRLERIKGVHHAIAIAKTARRRLVIAGNIVAEGPDAGYFDDEIRPHVDGRTIEYVGPVDDVRKNALLGASAALLMPIEWEEPFGIVMAEAMACGTPVIGFERGSVPEVVRPGINGFICRTVEEATALVPDACALDRRVVRADCEARFSQSAIVTGYERLYGEVVRAARL